MVKEVSLNIDSKLLEILDKRRGDLTRDEFIARMLTEHLNSSSKSDFEDLLKQSSEFDHEISMDADFLKALLKNFQEFATNITDRLDRLEKMMNSIEVEKTAENIKFDRSGKNNSVPKSSNEDVVFEIYEESEIDNEIYKFSDEEKYFEFDSSEDEIENDYETEGSANKDDKEFEYGCPFCNATIPENADRCPKCGNQFGELESADYAEPENTDLSYTGPSGYDPRPEYMKRREVSVSRVTARPDLVYQDASPSQAKVYPYTPDQVQRTESSRNLDQRDMPPPLCSICSGKLNYIEDYKRWYCHRCRKFSGGSPPKISSENLRFHKVDKRSEFVSDDSFNTYEPTSPASPMEPEVVKPIQEPRPTTEPVKAHKITRPKDRNWRPLKNYYKEND